MPEVFGCPVLWVRHVADIPKPLIIRVLYSNTIRTSFVSLAHHDLSRPPLRRAVTGLS